ncbi:MAG TPA: hypothetical protein V6C81_22620 [Planktothrix sp.]
MFNLRRFQIVSLVVGLMSLSGMPAFAMTAGVSHASSGGGGGGGGGAHFSSGSSNGGGSSGWSVGSSRSSGWNRANARQRFFSRYYSNPFGQYDPNLTVQPYSLTPTLNAYLPAEDGRWGRGPGKRWSRDSWENYNAVQYQVPSTVAADRQRENLTRADVVRNYNW